VGNYKYSSVKVLKIGLKPANSLSISQMVYIGIAVVIAAVTWFMRQSTMAKLDLTLQDKAAS